MCSNVGRDVSVCLLTYNHAHLLESTLDSIRRQSLPDIEIVVSDDCSTDRTWELILDAAGTDPRIRPMRTTHNLGMAGNANFAVGRSRRPYVALLHHDDLYPEDLLEKWLAAMLCCESAGFAFNPYSDGTFPRFPAAIGGRRCLDGHWLLEQYLFRYWGSVIRGTAMIRRSAWDSVGGMRERFGSIADVDLWMRLAMRFPVAYAFDSRILVRQERPLDYPVEYLASQGFSWSRRARLYGIHADNRLDYWGRNDVRNLVRWWLFRTRVSMDALKWIIYVVIRYRRPMLATCIEGANAYELSLIGLLRRLMHRLYA